MYRPPPRDGEGRGIPAAHGHVVGEDRTATFDPMVPWPPVGRERQTWAVGRAEGLTRRERATAAGGIYYSAVASDIADVDLTLPGWLAADVDDATAAIARFDSRAASFGGLPSVLLRSESASSSQIEQITASARAIAEAEVTGQGTGNAAVVAANVQAMVKALASTGPVDAARIADIQRSLLEVQAPKLVGWRAEPVWVGGRGSTPLNADYVAPDHTRIPASVDDLARFVARDDLPPLAQAAIAHAQFETIHPFADGNGRTGRALVQLILRDKDLTRSVTVPVSAGLLVDKSRYFQALTAYRAGDAASIISMFTSASILAVQHGEQFAERLTAITAGWRSKVTARRDSAVWRVLDVLPAHPVSDAATLAAAVRVDSRNIHRAVQPLLDAGILKLGQHHKSRRFLFRAPDILQALDEYAEMFGRRSR